MTKTDRPHRGHRRATVVGATLAISALASTFLAGAARADEGAVAAAAHQMPLVAGTPCTATASACVDLQAQRAWLLKDGKVTRGPIKISSGGNGQETPLGHSLRVYRKDQDHLSQESRLPNGQPAPMPYSVFFEDGVSPSTAATPTAPPPAASTCPEPTPRPGSTTFRSATRSRSSRAARNGPPAKT